LHFAIKLTNFYLMIKKTSSHHISYNRKQPYLYLFYSSRIKIEKYFHSTSIEFKKHIHNLKKDLLALRMDRKVPDLFLHYNKLLTYKPLTKKPLQY